MSIRVKRRESVTEGLAREDKVRFAGEEVAAFAYGTDEVGRPTVLAIGPAEMRAFRRLARRLEAAEAMCFRVAPDGVELRLRTPKGVADEIVIRTSPVEPEGLAQLGSFVCDHVVAYDEGVIVLTQASFGEGASLELELPLEVELLDEPSSLHEEAEEVEYGEGEYGVVTINRWTRTRVIHRFATQEEAEAQHARNVEADRPLAGAAMD